MSLLPRPRCPRSRTKSALAVWVLALAVGPVAQGEDKVLVSADQSRAAVDALQGLPKGQALPENLGATPLTREDARRAQTLLWDRHVATIRETRAEEVKERRLRIAEREMPFSYRIFGDKPARGRSLYLSMHGGGNAPARVNDQQYENQKKLYKPDEGVYLAARAPTNTWNLWHEPHIDAFFDRLIEDLIVFEDVDPDRVYVLGYSAGGDGVYQLAPRMADRWAAAAMMAGHPNDASPLSLRNLPFALFVGALDGAYDRNKVAGQWGEKLDKLRLDDPQGYEHWVEVVAGKKHWMDQEDAKAIPWMAKKRRVGRPSRVVWHQDDVLRDHAYWLGVDAGKGVAGSTVVANLEKQEIRLEVQGDIDHLKVRLDEPMVDLDQPVRVVLGEKVLFEGKVARTIATLQATLNPLGDPGLVFPSEVRVAIPPREPKAE